MLLGTFVDERSAVGLPLSIRFCRSHHTKSQPYLSEKFTAQHLGKIDIMRLMS